MKRCVFLLIACCLIGILCSCTATPIGNTLCITELQSAGADWVELYNYGDEPVALQGWYLSDDPNSLGKSPLPAVTLSPKERLVVSANTHETDTLAFGLNADGETVLLSNPQGKAVQTITLPASVSGLSYGCVENESFPPQKFIWYAVPTPASPNTDGMPLGENATATQYGVRINEYVSRNKTTLYDEEGDYGDWIELYNTSDSAVDLSGWSLTDTNDTTARWTFPTGTVLPAHGYRIVFCDGKNKSAASGELHTNFRLGQSDGFLALYTADGAFCSGVTCQPSEQDVSFGCDENGATVLCRYPTPLRANVTQTEVTAP